MDYTVSLVTMTHCWTLHVILFTLWWNETGYAAPVWRNNTLDLSFPHSGSLLKRISEASQRWILSSAHLSHSDTEQFKCIRDHDCGYFPVYTNQRLSALLMLFNLHSSSHCSSISWDCLCQHDCCLHHNVSELEFLSLELNFREDMWNV